MNNLSFDFSDNAFQSPTVCVRPENLTQYIGQQHLLAVGKPLPYIIGAGYLHSMILQGSPGTGKTTLAEVIARHADINVERISAVTSGVKGVHETIKHARQNRNAGRRIIFFVSEAHRFSKGQQDTFLPHIEDGTTTSIDVIIENPSFELSSILFSRARVYLLKSLSTEDIERVLTQATKDKTRGCGGQDIVLSGKTRRVIVELVSGDMRRALNTLEMMVDMAEVDDSGRQALKPELLTEVVGKRSACFSNKGDRFYDLISVLYKSIRGSTPDMVLYWYARIVTAGGDPPYIARRYLVIASEDVDNVDPWAMQVVIAIWNCSTRVDPAEGERVIAQAIVYLARASKSNAIYIAFKATLADAHERPDCDVPVYLRNTLTRLVKEMGYGQEYRYVHDEANIYAVDEIYFPSRIAQTHYYLPADRGLEGKVNEKLTWLIEQDQNSPIERYRQCYRCGDAVDAFLWSQVVATSPI